MEKSNYYTYEDLKKVLSVYMTEHNMDLIESYYAEAKDIYAGMTRLTGEDYIYHMTSVAYILAELKMDPITIGCSLIHEAISLEKRTYEEIQEKFGEESAVILSSLSKISSIKRNLNRGNNEEHDRRVVVGLAENPKALFIKFADRLHNLRTIYVFDKDHINEICDETTKILIPIAHRLGLKKFKSAFEDICLRLQHPDRYNEVLELINASREELEEALKEMKEEISELLIEHNISFEIMSRVKSVYGIYAKLEKGKAFNNIYDLLGLRVIVDEVEECYLVVGLIHSKYRNIPKRYKDFISNPKSNMYQSLHTTVFGVDGHMFEVQVRTYEMDEIAERGGAAHWSYKEKKEVKENKFEARLAAFRNLIELKELENNASFFDNIGEELGKDEIFVFTPKGDVIELPALSCPLDFAYRIHSEVGNTTTGALVNGRMVKLDYELSDGDVVSLITNRNSEPNKDWLNFVKTDNARNRIRSYFSKQEKAKLLEVGEELLINEIKKKKLSVSETLSDENVEKLLADLKIDNMDEVYISIASSKWLPSFVVERILGVPEEKEDILTKILKTKDKSPDEKKSILVCGDDDILYSFASCCNPVYGEPIKGYVTKGQGVSVHRADCPNVKDLTERIIDIEWNTTNENKFNAYIHVYVDSSNVDLVPLFTKATIYEVFVEGMNLKENKNGVYYEMNLRVKNIELLNDFIDAIKLFKFVSRVERVSKNEAFSSKK